VLAAIATAADTTPLVTGKPHHTMAALVQDMCGDVVGHELMMIGDRPNTDGAFARSLSCRFGLVLSGVTSQDAVRDFEMHDGDMVASDLSGIVDQIMGLS
jgi:ribonucleotide monophosphatase NagD (HAD superfamily)